MKRPIESLLIVCSLALVAGRELYADSLQIWAGKLSSNASNDQILGTILEISILIVVCISHFVLERRNWQMAGVYIVTVVASFYALIWIVAPESSLLLSHHPYIRVFFRILAALLVLLSVTLRVLLPQPRLPKLPKSLVGTREFYWDFTQQEQENPPARGLRSQLLEFGVPAQKTMRVRVWYPCDAPSSQKAPYIAEPVLKKTIQVFLDIEGKKLDFANLITSHLLLSKTNSWLDSPISNAQSRWPLLVMSHGLKASPEVYSAYAEYFASMGFIVVAPAHTDGSCPENWKGQGPGKWNWDYCHAQLRQRVQDISMLVTHIQKRMPDLSERIDWGKVAVSGHSFGGCTTVGVLKLDNRFSSGVGWDTWMWPLGPEEKEKISSVAMLFINSEWFLHGEGREVNLESINQSCRSNTSGGHVCMLKDTAHHNYNDMPLLLHPKLADFIRKGNGPPKALGALNANRALEVTMDQSYLFLNAALNKDLLSQTLFSTHPELEYAYVAPNPTHPKKATGK